MQFIINADDFGLSDDVNRAIVQCFRDGTIHRTTLMVNMPQAEQAACLAKQHGFFDCVGLHMNLVEGPALSERCRRNPILCGADGRFLGQFHRSIPKRVVLGSEERAAIRDEMEAQIQKYLRMGFPLKHADSHQYVHTYFSAALPILPLLEQYGFRSVRISRNIPGNDLSLPFAIYKNLYNHWLSRLKPNGQKIGHTDYFGSLEDYFTFQKMYPEADGICELMVHPVYHGEQLMDDTLPNPKPFFTRQFLREHNIVESD